MLKDKIIEIYVELFDEGTPTMIATKAKFLGNDLFEVLSTGNYDPEDQIWEFPPSSIVRLEKVKLRDGEEVLLARHENLNIIKINVEEVGTDSLLEAYAMKLPNGKYELLPTHNYNPEIRAWRTPPGSIVELEERTYTGTNFSYLTPKL